MIYPFEQERKKDNKRQIIINMSVGIVAATCSVFATYVSTQILKNNKNITAKQEQVNSIAEQKALEQQKESAGFSIGFAASCGLLSLASFIRAGQKIRG
ncbi:MAG: hypothetical protein GX944_00960 [Alphaproteobacteria bacterium]|nr:hypothetical protein [Alphaproteobacteria bacterium]